MMNLTRIVLGLGLLFPGVIIAVEGNQSVVKWPPLPSTINWKSTIGYSGGGPVLQDGAVYVTGEVAGEKMFTRKGTLFAFSTKDGTRLGLISHLPLPQRIHDIGGALWTTPAVAGDRLYYVNNRAELIALDTKRFLNPNRQAADSPVAWSLDMPGKLGVFKRDVGDVGIPLPNAVVWRDLVFCVTGNGAYSFRPEEAKKHGYVPKPDAPSFLAVKRATGEVAWSSNAPGKDILYGSWGTPVVAQVGDQSVVLFPGGDGVLYAFEAITGKQLGKVDCNDPKATRWEADKPRGTRGFFATAPVVRAGIAYISNNQDLEGGPAVRRIYAVDLAHQNKPGNLAIVWSFSDPDYNGSHAPLALGQDAVYALSQNGILICLDLKSGRLNWKEPLTGGMLNYNSTRFPAPVVANGMVYAACECGLYLLRDDPAKVMPVGVVELDHDIRSAPVIDGKTLYVATEGFLYRLTLK